MAQKQQYEMVDNRVNPKSGKKWFAWAISGVIVLGIGAGAYALSQNSPAKEKTSAVAESNKTKTESNSEDSNKAGSGVKADTSSNGTTESSVANGTDTGSAAGKTQNTESFDLAGAQQSLNDLSKFDFNSTNLTQPLKNKISEVAKNWGAVKEITLIGYTDSNGSDEYNLKLGKMRAEAVERYIQSIDQNVAIQILSKGKADPIADNSTEEGRSKNRRVEFVLSSN